MTTRWRIESDPLANKFGDLTVELQGLERQVLREVERWIDGLGGTPTKELWDACKRMVDVRRRREAMILKPAPKHPTKD